MKPVSRPPLCVFKYVSQSPSPWMGSRLSFLAGAWGVWSFKGRRLILLWEDGAITVQYNSAVTASLSSWDHDGFSCHDWINGSVCILNMCYCRYGSLIENASVGEFLAITGASVEEAEITQNKSHDSKIKARCQNTKVPGSAGFID